MKEGEIYDNICMADAVGHRDRCTRATDETE